MNLSPVVRTLLAAIVAAATAALTLTADGVSLQDGIIILLAGIGAFGIVPPQVGGTQQGVVNPSLAEPPHIDR